MCQANWIISGFVATTIFLNITDTVKYQQRMTNNIQPYASYYTLKCNVEKPSQHTQLAG